MKKSIFLLALLLLVGCSNTDNPIPANDKESNKIEKQNIDVAQLKNSYSNLQNIKDDDIISLYNQGVIFDSQQLSEFRSSLFEQLEYLPTTMQSYHKLKTNINIYGKSIAVTDNPLPKLNELQSKLNDSPISKVDFDEDGAIDIHEIMILNSSPHSKSSKDNGKLDGKLASNVDMFIFQSGGKYIVTNISIQDYVKLAIDLGKINDNTYIQLKARIYADEMKSIIINIKNGGTLFTGSLPKDVQVYPIAVTVSGLKAGTVPGEIIYYHKGAESPRNSFVQWIQVDGEQGVNEFLERAKDYTRTSDVIKMNRTYALILGSNK